MNNQSSSAKFQGIGNAPRAPVYPTHGESETGVNEARCILREGTRDGKVGRQLGERLHDGVHESSDEHIGEKGSRGTCRRDTLA